MRLFRGIASFIQKIRHPGELLPGSGRTAAAVARAGNGVAVGRTIAAPLYRRSVRATLVVLGLGLYALVNLWLAQQIIDLRWYFVLAFFMVAASAVLALVKPVAALVLWLLLSPIASRLFKLDWGTGLPAITFDRSVIYFLAITLLARALVNKVPMTRLKLAEWLLLLFPAFILLTGPFIQKESVPSFVFSMMARSGDLCLFYFAAKACITRKEHALWVLGGIAVVGLYATAMGAYDHFTGKMSLTALAGVEFGLIWGDVGGRAAGPFLSPGVLGLVLGMAAAVIFHLSNWITSKPARLGLYVLLLAMVAVWYWTYTRGGYTTMAAFILLMPLFARGARKPYLALLAAVVLAAAVVLPISFSNRAVNERMTSSRTLKSRTLSGAALLGVAKHYPFFGVGINNSYSEMRKHITSVGGTPGLVIWQGIGTWPMRYKFPVLTASHVTYMTFLAEHGLIGTGIWLGAFVAFLVLVWRARSRLGSGILGTDLASTVAVLIIGYLVGLATHHVEPNEYVNYMLYLLVVVVVKLDSLRQQETDEERQEEARPRLAPVLTGDAVA